MRSFTQLTDPGYTPPTHYSRFDKFWLTYLADERDLPFVYLSLKISLSMIPAGILLFFPLNPYIWWPLTAFYTYLNNFVFKGPFGLMLHCTSHRTFFKRKHTLLNRYLPWVVGPFFGQTPETYFSHHLGMHHAENNLEEDLSTTMPYKRDSFRSFMRYFGKFLFLGFVELVNYFHKRNRKKLRDKVLRGELGFFLFCILLSFISVKGMIAVFLLPYFVSRFIMMLGNWTQHAFIDPEEPENCFRNSITCINTAYNHKCWNDGYHINHHLKPAMHWTQYPQHFEENIQHFAKNRALVFEGVHYLHMWWYLMAKDYRRMAAHLVNINDIFSSEEEAITLMRLRTEPIPLNVSGS